MIRRRLVSHKVDLPPIDWKFYLSVVTGLLIATALYGFLLGLRELVRTVLEGYFWYSHATATRLYFYNVFIALISYTVGFATFSNMWMLPNSRIDLRVRLTVMLDQQYVPGNFIFLATKLGLFCGFMLGSTYYIDFSIEFWPFFLLSPVVMFLQQWLTLRRRIRQATVKAMALAACIQLAFSFSIAAVPIYDSERLSQMAIRHTPDLALDLNLPTSKASTRMYRRSLVEAIYVGYRKDTKELAINFGLFNSTYIPADSLSNRVRDKRYELMESEQVYFDLYADKNIPARTILNMVHIMRKDGDIGVNFITNDIRAEGGVRQFFSEDTEKEISKRDGFEISELRLHSNKIMLNDSIISQHDLYDWFYVKIWSNYLGKSPRTAIRIGVDELSDYATLVSVFDAAFSAVLNIRTEEVRKRFGEEYDPGYSYGDVADYANEFRAIYFVME